MEQGIAPLLSAEYCRNLEAEPALDPAGLQVLWEPSDDGAALWYYGQLLAVIPGWSLYQEKQVSFSAGCIKKNRLTAPLGSASTNDYYARAEHQRQFWRDYVKALTLSGIRFGAHQSLDVFQSSTIVSLGLDRFNIHIHLLHIV